MTPPCKIFVYKKITDVLFFLSPLTLTPPNENAKISKTYAMEGFERFLDDEKAELVLQDYYYPKHWLTFHMCSHPITDRFPDKPYESLLNFYIIIYDYYNV